MSLKDRIALTCRYSKALILVGAVFDYVCLKYLAGGISYSFIVDIFLVKTFITAVVLFLMKEFRGRDAVFFYINLGLSGQRMVLWTVLADYLLLAILIAAICIING